MCDYSLESVNRRDAVEGEDLVVKRFKSGSKGFVEAADSDCAVCCKSGVEMTLVLSGKFTTYLFNADGFLHDYKWEEDEEKLEGEIPVKFHTLPLRSAYFSSYRDGFILPNGRFLSVQGLQPGTRATVTKALPKELTEAAAGKVAFEPEIRVQEIVAPVLVD
jgi:hypothetical protein